MRLRRHISPLTCDAPKCGRVAVSRLSNGPDKANSCGLHITKYEHLWGQVFVRGMK